MAVISVSGTNSLIDAFVAYYRKVVGTQATGYGYGSKGGAYGACAAIADIKAAVLGLADLVPVASLAPVVGQLEAVIDGGAKAAGDLSSTLSALQQHVSSQGLPSVRTLDDFLVYRNTAEATKWQCLQNPDWKLLAEKWIAGLTVSRFSVWYEVLQGATFTNGLGKWAFGAGFTAGASVPSTHAGGTPQLRVSGLAGSGVVTVTGTALDPASKTAIPAKTWTATVNANGVVALAPGGGSPAPTDSLIVAVSNISAAVGITAGTIYVEAARPAGRAA